MTGVWVAAFVLFYCRSASVVCAIRGVRSDAIPGEGTGGRGLEYGIAAGVFVR